MNIRWLESFIAVAREGSISKAAAGQFVSAQALTQQINLLEGEVGARLFDRTTKGVSLTDAGTAMLDGAQRIIDLWDATCRRCRETPGHRGTVVTPMCMGFAAPDIEAAYREYQRSKAPDEPDLKLAINDDYKNWIQGLRDGAYDFIRYVRVGDVHPLGMYFEPVREITAWCLVHPSHPLAGREVVRSEDLAGMRVVTSDRRVVRKLLDLMEGRGLPLDVAETPMSRMHIIDALDAGNVCIFSKVFVHGFDGYVCAPIDCPIDNWEGLLCMEERAPELRHIFEVFHRHMAGIEI